MIELVYQNDAIKRLHTSFKHIWNTTGGICVFRSPTGSGKTIMVANFIRQLVQNRDDRISFVWVAPMSLSKQSKGKLERIYNDVDLRCSDPDDIQDGKIAQNEIMFVNWESINRIDGNIWMAENERGENIPALVSNSKDVGHKIIMIIDESHHTAQAEGAREAISIIRPDLTLEVSATPVLSNPHELVPVQIQDVKDAGMIKKQIKINDFSDRSTDLMDLTKVLIEEGLKKRGALKEKFARLNVNVNPMMLIQLPNKKALQSDLKEETIKVLEENGISTSNGKLAIYTENEKITDESLTENDNKTEVLIFKQALALGWDCPRAYVLVMLRELKSEVFKIQTIGRIMRMPEPEHGHYQDDDDLNHGYIFTNATGIKFDQDYVKEIISMVEAHRDEKLYRPIKLRSVYFNINRKSSRLYGSFVDVFNSPNITNMLKSRIKSTQDKVSKPIPYDVTVDYIDEESDLQIDKTINATLAAKDLNRMFMDYVRWLCPPFAPSDSSQRICTALYNFVNREYGLEKYSPEAQTLILGEDNIRPFAEAIEEAKNNYKEKVVIKEEKRLIEINEKWEVPESVSSCFGVDAIDYPKAVMRPVFVTNLSKPERHFINYLEQSQNVKWWYKNGENERKYFAISYIDGSNQTARFYVDFIVQLEDGRVGLFDPKEGMTAKDAGTRHKGLYQYMINENKKGKNLFGGLVVNPDGRGILWKIFTEADYHYDSHDMSDWETLQL